MLVIFIMTFITGFAVYYYSEVKEVNDIHRQAKVISGRYYSVFPSDYINEALTFLEENRDKNTQIHMKEEKRYMWI